MKIFQAEHNRLYFSRWCRKGYALFAAIGRQVRICALSIGICKRALDKSGRKGIIVSMAGCIDGTCVLPDPEILSVRYAEICIARGYLCPDGKESERSEIVKKDMSPCRGIYPFFNV